MISCLAGGWVSEIGMGREVDNIAVLETTTPRIAFNCLYLGLLRRVK